MPVAPRTRLLNGLLGAVIALVSLTAAGFWVQEGSVRLRADVPVAAVMVGEPGCVTAAEFSGADGRRHSVDLRRYRSNCIDGRPGEQVTVYYDAEDPSVHSRSQRWWWPSLLALLALPIAFVGSRGVILAVRGISPPRTERPTALRVRRGLVRGPRGRTAAREVADPGRAELTEPSAQLYREDDRAHLVYDYALQRLEVLHAEVRAELTAPAGTRASTSDSAMLAAVSEQLDAVRHALLQGSLDRAETHYAAIARLVDGDRRTDSALVERLLAFRRTMLRG